jgi:hypothetical protein
MLHVTDIGDLSLSQTIPKSDRILPCFFFFKVGDVLYTAGAPKKERNSRPKVCVHSILISCLTRLLTFRSLAISFWPNPTYPRERLFVFLYTMNIRVVLYNILQEGGFMTVVAFALLKMVGH